MGAGAPGGAELDGASADEPLLAFLRLLADGGTGDAIGACLAEGLLREAAPTQLSVYLVDAAGECLEEHARYGAETEPDHRLVPLDLALPMTEVFRTGRSGVWTMTEAAEQFPAIAGYVRSRPEHAADETFVVPIRAQGRPVGVLLVALPGPADRSWQLGRLLEAASTALAVWAVGRLSVRPRPGARPRVRGIEVSDRQRRIVEGVRVGRSNAEIAADLDVSVGTVKADLSALYRLFAVSQREALVDLVPAARSGQRRRS
jgi:DNA-binding CsgD family transcriptional regulator